MDVGFRHITRNVKENKVSICRMIKKVLDAIVAQEKKNDRDSVGTKSHGEDIDGWESKIC